MDRLGYIVQNRSETDVHRLRKIVVFHEDTVPPAARRQLFIEVVAVSMPRFHISYEIRSDRKLALGEYELREPCAVIQKVEILLPPFVHFSA